MAQNLLLVPTNKKVPHVEMGYHPPPLMFDTLPNNIKTVSPTPCTAITCIMNVQLELMLILTF